MSTVVKPWRVFVLQLLNACEVIGLSLKDFQNQSPTEIHFTDQI